MPLFPPAIDTLRWEDLVYQGRSQLPLVAPSWTDENVSDPGIAALELLSWLIEAESYRSSAVTDRERLLLLQLAGFRPRPATPATCLVKVSSTAAHVPTGLLASGSRESGNIPLTLLDDTAVTGAAVAALVWTSAAAADDDYRSGCVELTHDHVARRPVQPFGPDPAPGDALVIGLDIAGGLPAGPVDLWFIATAGLLAPEQPAPQHHSARADWEVFDGNAWQQVDPHDVADETATLTRSGRARLDVPVAAATLLGDQADGVFAGARLVWLRCRLVAGRHDAPPLVSAVYIDAGRAEASHPYSCDLTIPIGTPVTGAPVPGPHLMRTTLRLVVSGDGRVTSVAFDPPAGQGAPIPAVDVVSYIAPTAAAPGQLVADVAVLGPVTGVPNEILKLPQAWCGEPPALWCVAPNGSASPIPVVADLAAAHAGEYAAHLECDGAAIRFGDGQNGATLPAGTTVLAAGRWTTSEAIGELGPPLDVAVPIDARSTVLLGADAATTAVALLDGLAPGASADDVGQTAARANATMWVHDRLTAAVQRVHGTSLDDLPLQAVRLLDVPERGVTALDMERRALATPGTALWRARAIPELDPRLPGLRADGCITVVVVPSLPVGEPSPTPELLSRIRAELAATRTLGTRVFVVGPDYVRIGVRATLTPQAEADATAMIAAATQALHQFLHPVTGGPSGRGWPFGRAVRRAEVLQMLDSVTGVDRVTDLVFARERGAARPEYLCGDVAICVTQLALAGSVELTATASGARR